MHRAGYVLTGGLSTRMGSDKALLPFKGGPLVVRVAQIVAQAAGSVTLVGRADQLSHLGLPVIEDRHAGCGPLGGVQAALSHTTAKWCLVTACDMPLLDAGFLTRLLEFADHHQPDAVMARSAAGRPEPLCAVYHSRCLAAAEQAIQTGKLKITAAFERLDVRLLDGMDGSEQLGRPRGEAYKALALPA